MMDLDALRKGAVAPEWIRETSETCNFALHLLVKI